MSDLAQTKRVLIIDRQSFWRDKAALALGSQGYEVQILDTYNYEPGLAYFAGGPPDLVILGCSRLQHDERELINNVLADHRHLVVFCSSLPWGDMRTLFMAGADDVVDKPYDSARVVSIVEEAFANMGSMDAFRPGERKGAV
jgi:DNA-binding response OmpR family regulator